MSASGEVARIRPPRWPKLVAFAGRLLAAVATAVVVWHVAPADNQARSMVYLVSGVAVAAVMLVVSLVRRATAST